MYTSLQTKKLTLNLFAAVSMPAAAADGTGPIPSLADTPGTASRDPFAATTKHTFYGTRDHTIAAARAGESASVPGKSHNPRGSARLRAF